MNTPHVIIMSDPFMSEPWMKETINVIIWSSNGMMNPCMSEPLMFERTEDPCRRKQYMIKPFKCEH